MSPDPRYQSNHIFVVGDVVFFGEAMTSHSQIPQNVLEIRKMMDLSTLLPWFRKYGIVFPLIQTEKNGIVTQELYGTCCSS